MDTDPVCQAQRERLDSKKQLAAEKAKDGWWTVDD